MPKQPYDLEFQPEQRRRRDQLLRFLGGFCAIVLLLGIVSAVALQRDGLVDQIIAALHPTEPPTEPPKDAWTHSGSATFLLCETDGAQRELRFCALVRVDVARRQAHVFPLSPKAMTPHEDGERTLEQALREGGPKAVKAAAQALTESEIDRYISSDDAGFIKAVNALGSVTVQVDARISYKSEGFTLTLAQGSQRLQGDMLLRYFRYLGTLGEGAAAAQGALLKRVLETYLSLPADQAQLETRFNGLMNTLQTDVTVNDFFTRTGMLLDLIASADKFVVDVRE